MIFRSNITEISSKLVENSSTKKNGKENKKEKKKRKTYCGPEVLPQPEMLVLLTALLLPGWSLLEART